MRNVNAMEASRTKQVHYRQLRGCTSRLRTDEKTSDEPMPKNCKQVQVCKGRRKLAIFDSSILVNVLHGEHHACKYGST